MSKSALGPEDYVYQGIWTDWDRGKYLGPTLTVDAHTARIVSPALALLVTTTGFSVWKICRYALHQMRARPGYHDVLYHQTQLVLRNSCTDLDVANKFLWLAFAWKNRKEVKVLKTILPLFLAAIIHFAFFAAFGILSSWSLQAPDRVLSRSPYCGTWNSTYHNQVFSLNHTSLSSVALANAYTSYVNSRYSLAQRNIESCDEMSGCSTSRNKGLNWTSEFVPNACPAPNNSICHPDAGGSLRFDTGYLSSHSDLGYNARSEDRIKFRMVAECSPLVAEGYVTDWHNTPAVADLPARQVVNAYYGTTASSNVTYMRTKRVFDCGERKLTQPYTLIPFVTEPNGSIKSQTANFGAIPALMPTDRDLSLILMTFDNAYGGPVSDPWFSAQKAVNVSESFCLYNNNTVYIREHEITALVCTQQWQICDNEADDSGGKGACSSLSGISEMRRTMLTMADQRQLNDLQLATAQRIFRTGITSTFFYVIQALSQAGSPPLKARDFVSYQSQPALPNNQWQTEARHWMNLVVEYFQQANLDYSSGQFAASTAYINVTEPVPGTSPSDRAQNAAYSLCQNQLIYSRDFTNYNFVALMCTVVICLILVLCGFLVECLTTSTRQRNLRYTGESGRQDMWNANDALDMFQRLDEFKNGTTWTRACFGIPVTHSSHQIDINDLSPHKFEVDDGSGIVLPAVQRRREMEKGLASGTSLDKSTTCVTCEAVSSHSTETDINRSLLPGHDLRESTGLSGAATGSGYDLRYHNGFRRDFLPDLREVPQSGHIC